MSLTGHVEQPDKRLDAGGRTDGDRQLPDIDVRVAGTQGAQRILDPGDRTALAQLGPRIELNRVLKEPAKSTSDSVLGPADS